MDYRLMTAPCGLDCFNCVMYKASQDDSLRESIAPKMALAPDEAQCPGCRVVEGKITFLGMSGPCKVYRCIQDKGFDLCCDCEDFPCDNLHPYADMAQRRPHNLKAFNLALIKKMGLEKWAETKAKAVREAYFKGKLEL